MCILFIYCCRTNNLEVYSFKHSHLFSQFLWVRNLGLTYLSSSLQDPSLDCSQVTTRAEASSKDLTASKLAHMVVGKNQLLESCLSKTLSSSMDAYQRTLSPWQMTLFSRANNQKSQEENASRIDVSVFHSLTSDVPYHDITLAVFCFLEVSHEVYSQQEWSTQAHEDQELSITGAYISGFLPQDIDGKTITFLLRMFHIW